jgi:hypothetical protein
VHWEETKVGLPGGAELIRMVRQLRLQSLALTSDTNPDGDGMILLLSLFCVTSNLI